MSMVKLRQELERRIATQVVKDALAAGYVLVVDNGGDEPDYKGTDETACLSAMFATDDERLYLFKPGGKWADGWVYFVYGNDGWDVINDYTTNLESLLKSAHEIADKYAD